MSVIPPRRGRLIDRLLSMKAPKEKKAEVQQKAVDVEALNSAWNTVTDLLLNPDFFYSFEEFFANLDRDGSAELSFEELKDGLMIAGCSFTPRELRAFRLDVDVNKDGSITLAEFMDASRRHQAKGDTDAKAAEEAWGIMGTFLLNPQTKKNVEELFHEMNVDGSDDGLDLDELARGMRRLGAQLTAPQLRAWQKDLDSNKDGNISLEEFTLAVEERRNANPEETANVLASAWDTVIDFALDPKTNGDLERMFNRADLTRNGVLNLDELAHGLAAAGVSLDARELRAFQKDLDLNQDGVINYDEFMEAVRRYQASSVINHAAADEAWDWTLDVLAGPEQAATVAEIFQRMDKDGNNQLDLDELAKGIIALGVPLSPRQLRAFQKALDSSGDGLVTLEEFLEALANQQTQVEQALREAWDSVIDFSMENEDSGATLEGLFEHMDMDGSGMLDFEELAKGLYEMGVRMKPRGLRAFRKDVDASGDGVVDPAEFMEGVRRYQAASAQDPAMAREAWVLALDFFDDEGALEAASKLFTNLDTDANSQLDLAELIRGLAGLGLNFSAKQTRAFQKSLDKNNDGLISFREFKATLDERYLTRQADAWHQVPSSSNPEELFWHNDVTGETRWETPPEVRPPPAAAGWR